MNVGRIRKENYSRILIGNIKTNKKNLNILIHLAKNIYFKEKKYGCTILVLFGGRLMNLDKIIKKNFSISSLGNKLSFKFVFNFYERRYTNFKLEGNDSIDKINSEIDRIFNKLENRQKRLEEKREFLKRLDNFDKTLYHIDLTKERRQGEITSEKKYGRVNYYIREIDIRNNIEDSLRIYFMEIFNKYFGSRRIKANIKRKILNYTEYNFFF